MFVNSSKPGRKNFHGLNLTKPKMKCFVKFAVNIPPFVTKVGAFFWVLTVHRGLVFVVKARLDTISRYHYFCFERAKNETRPEQAPLVRMNRKINKESQERLEKLFNTVHFIAKEKLAITKFSNLCILQEKNGLNIGQHYRNPTACKAFISAIANHERNKFLNDVRDSSYSL